MLHEQAVVASVCDYLDRHGFETTAQEEVYHHGPDLVATRGSVRLIDEAKGEGSSQTHTMRYGRQTRLRG